jgi:hypothetical protein
MFYVFYIFSEHVKRKPPFSGSYDPDNVHLRKNGFPDVHLYIRDGLQPEEKRGVADGDKEILF